MPYEVEATSPTPALIIYLLDISYSMNNRLGEKRRVDVVMEALKAALRTMIFRSTKGGQIAPRYRLAMLAYSSDVYDLLGGIKPVTEVAKLGVPGLGDRQNLMRTTETAKAFAQAETILQAEIPSLARCPAPLICHMTDGENTGEDPIPIVRRIMQLSNPDGSVLVENIFISDDILTESIADPLAWPGIMPETRLRNRYAQVLQQISSPLPRSYRDMMAEMGYNLDPRALMMLPGMDPQLVQMGFQMSASTKVR